ncbi:response regulator [Aquabacter cavernae]|uniref:response regulator n=1 Tax=Aquabacter cavernae TaxID=2496029 RepID=UPI001FDEBFA0|nr:response regulator [Aquabacter cavernae]
MIATLFDGDGGSGLTALLAGLAAIGVFTVITTAVRFMRGEERRTDDLTRTLFAATSDAVALVENGDELVQANAAYLRLSRSREGQSPTPERFLSRIPGAQANVATLLRSIADGSSGLQSFPFDSDPSGRRLMVSVHPLDSLKRVLWVLSLADAGGAKLGGVPAESRPRVAAVATATPAIGIDSDVAAQLMALWEAAPVGLMLISPEEGRLANGTLARWLGYDLAEWGSGIAFSELFDAASQSAVVRAFSADQGGPASLDVDLIRKDGSAWPAHVWISGRPGGVSILAAVARTAQAPVAVQGAPPALPAGTETDFFSRSPLAMASVDRTGRVVEANGSFTRLFAGAGIAVLGAKLERLVLERDAAAVDRLLKDTVSGQAPVSPVEASIAGEGGRSARLYAALLGPAGSGIAVYAVDMTAQRTLEAQFAQSQKMQAIGQLAGGVAHDFNNVLTAILGYCDLLLANHRPSDPSFPDIMQIKQNANRAAGLVRQLLAFSRRQTLRPQVIHLPDVLSDLSMLLRRLIGESIDLKVEHGRDLWPVRVDVNQFEQVVVNLAVNARDAMPGGGQLTIRTLNVPAQECERYGDAATLAAADYVLIEVSDSGTGIPPDIMDKIFEPFFSTKEVGKGTGLGLSTVYGIVKQTGGNILPESELGRGTVFRVFLPRHVAGAEDVPVPALEAEPRPAPDLTGQGTILLVEDEDAVRAFATRALTARGYNVISAASGAEALEAMDHAGARVDLVISDVVMPEMDGPTLLKALRARDPGLKVIFISGYAQEAFGKNLAEGETFAFLPKPFSLKQLVAAVKEATAG